MGLSEEFDVRRFLGRGCYSMVYEAFHTEGVDKDKPYAFKRFFLQNPSAIHCALRERNVLVRLAEEEYQSPFLPTLFYSFTIHGSPTLLLREGTGCDLFDLLRSNGLLNESQARFYTSELISGLEHLHSLGIVHLDLKPENVLLCLSGHVFISDFDRSYDLCRNNKSPSDDDFTGTPLFMAPEIAKGEIITTKADIWSLAVLMAELVSGPIRSVAKNLDEDLRWAKEGRYAIKAFNRLTKPLQAFFSACFKRRHQERPDISGIKGLRFYKHVNWDVVRSCSQQPPILPSSINHRPDSEAICKLDPHDPILLAAAYGKVMPVVRKRLRHAIELRDDGASKLITEPPDYEGLSSAGMTPEVIERLFANFQFINPTLRPIVKEISVGTEVKVEVLPSLFEKTVEEIEDLEKSFGQNRIRARTCSAGD
ncbi:unnamed protein product [Mesocestoides corti]|uniref:Protein kinase domain-containing protein n=1 Tax=Mesocestoides corti TaxID=53468 RepID=A0A0R3U905_MESCO|nr:unnamed protein product [Mesocestoides corti]